MLGAYETDLENGLCRVSVESLQRHRVPVRHHRLKMSHIWKVADMIQLHKIKLFISVVLEKILITSDIMVVSVSRLVVKSRSRSWLCDLSPEPTSVGDEDLRESL